MSPDLHTPDLHRRGLMLILSSPSGAGKTTLTRNLLQDRALDLTLSISVICSNGPKSMAIFMARHAHLSKLC